LIFESNAVAADSDNGTLNNCSYSNTSIHSIQGVGHKSPIKGCYVSGVQGIVTLNTSNGFYIQDPHPDNDNSTSEGIFVYTKPKDAKKGDLVSVNGTVSEFQGKPPNPNILSITEIINPISRNCNSKKFKSIID
jgi:predicted extracellular nuclease